MPLSDIDIEYNEAILNGDYDLGHALALKQASIQGYSIPAFHGTPYIFNEFHIGDIGFHFAKSRYVALNRLDDALEDAAFKDMAYVEDGVMLNVVLSINNPIVLTADLMAWTARDIFKAAGFKLTNTPFLSPEEMFVTEQRNMSKCAYRLLKLASYSDDDILSIKDELTRSEHLNHHYTTQLNERLMNSPYDGIIYPNDYENQDGEDPTSYIVFSPTQVKSIDPIIVKDGNLKPLSTRFNHISPRLCD